VVQAVQAVAVVPMQPSCVMAEPSPSQPPAAQMPPLAITNVSYESAPASASGIRADQQQQLERQRLLEQDAAAAGGDALELPPMHDTVDVPPSATMSHFGAGDDEDEATAAEDCWAEQVMSSDWLSSFEQQAAVL